MKKAKDFRDMTVDELESLHSDYSKELFQLRNQLKFDKKLEKPHLIAHKRKEIARLLTIKQQKQNANQKQRA